MYAAARRGQGASFRHAGICAEQDGEYVGGADAAQLSSSVGCGGRPATTYTSPRRMTATVDRVAIR
jgi:hypothetical protein